MTILSFAAIFAGLGLVETSGGYALAAALVMGVFLGSVLWWLLLSGSVSLSRWKLSPGTLQWANNVSGIIILGFGAGTLLSVLHVSSYSVVGLGTITSQQHRTS
jgi:arginine exporter protein ArgO